MRITKDTKLMMRDKLQIGLDYLNARARDCHGKQPTVTLGDLSLRDIQQLWFRVCASINFNSDNPNVWKLSSGDRVFSQDEGFAIYPDGANDNHMRTAFIWIIKQAQTEVTK